MNLNKHFMKTMALLLCFGATMLISSCQGQDKKQPDMATGKAIPMDMTSEIQKLKDLCILETQLFLEGKSSDHLYLDDPDKQVIQKTSLAEEVLWIKGGKVIKKGPLPFLDEHPNFVLKIIERTGWVTKITDEMAYVTYLQHVNWQDSPEDKVQDATSHEIRVFVREGDSWKIALASTIF